MHVGGTPFSHRTLAEEAIDPRLVRRLYMLLLRWATEQLLWLDLKA